MGERMRSGRTALLILSLGGAAVLAGCHHPHPFGSALFPGSAGRPYAAIDRLDCPAQVDELQRTAEATDGRSCQYRDDDDGGEDVDLTLVALNGQPAASALAPTEAALKAQIGPQGGGQPSVAVNAGSGADGDHAKIDLPGFHLDAAGDRANIKLFGMTIDANGDNAHINTRYGHDSSAVIDAHPGGAVIRAGDSGPDGTNMTLVLASDRPGPNGDHAAGYIARGPASGPLVVAAFTARQSRHDDLGGHGLDRLMDLNLRR